MKITKPEWTIYIDNDNDIRCFMHFDCKVVNGVVCKEYMTFLKDEVNDFLMKHFSDNYSDYKTGSDVLVTTHIDSFNSEDCGKIYVTKEEAEKTSINGIEPHIDRPIDIATEIIDYDYSLNELREIAEHLKVYCDCQESELPFEDVK